MYLFKDDGIFGNNDMLRKAGPGDMVRNSLVFAWAFMETSLWFWVSSRSTYMVQNEYIDAAQVFLSLRDERREIVRRRMEKMKAEEDRL